MRSARNVLNAPYANDPVASELSRGGVRSILPPAFRKFDLRTHFLQEKQRSPGSEKIQTAKPHSIAYYCGKKFNARRPFLPRLVSDQSRL